MDQGSGLERAGRESYKNIKNYMKNNVDNVMRSGSKFLLTFYQNVQIFCQNVHDFIDIL